MNIIRASDPAFTELWNRLFVEDTLQYPLLSPLGVEYSIAYAPDSRFEPLSFLVEENGLPIAGVQMSVHERPDGRNELSGFGRSIMGFIKSRRAESLQRDKGGEKLQDEFRRIVDERFCQSVLYMEFEAVLSPIGRLLLDRGAVATPVFSQVIHLSSSELELRQQIRSRFKGHINWGLKNLQLVVVDNASPVEEQIEKFRQLHIEVAGRETRPVRSWQIQAEMIRRNEAFAVFGYLEGNLVTALLFIHSPNYCYYGVGASKRELFDKPLSHCIMWTGIIEAKKRGCQFFETGEQLFVQRNNPPPTPKELNISGFKKGFGGETRIRLEITLNQ